MIATLAAPKPDTVEIVGVAVVVLVVAYVLLFEIGLPTLRNWLDARRNPRPGYLFDRDDERIAP